MSTPPKKPTARAQINSTILTFMPMDIHDVALKENKRATFTSLVQEDQQAFSPT